jgi:hypothetical protein
MDLKLCPLVLLVKAGRRQIRPSGIVEGKVMRIVKSEVIVSGLFQHAEEERM